MTNKTKKQMNKAEMKKAKGGFPEGFLGECKADDVRTARQRRRHIFENPLVDGDVDGIDP